MNQILLTEDRNSSKNSKKNIKNEYEEEFDNSAFEQQEQPVRNVNTNSNDIKRIIIFFAVVIIVFGVALGAIYGYRVYKNKQKQENPGSSNNSSPEVSLNEDANNPDKLIITANSEAGIDKIIYIFDGEKQEESLNGKKNLEKNIIIPEGISDVEIQVIDMNGNVTPTYKTFDVSTAEKPKIETAIIENGKLKITATSPYNTMKYIVYEWNDEEKITVNAEEESSKIEVVVDVKRGKNEIKIIAVDSSNNKETVTKTFNGVNTPTIDVVKDEDKLIIKVAHDMGIKKIEYDFNGKLYKYDENYSKYDPEKTEVEFFFTLKEGENNIIVTATSSEETEEVYSGRCSYTAEAEE